MKKFYSIRVVDANNIEEAIEKIENGEFDETYNMSDCVLDANESFDAFGHIVAEQPNEYISYWAKRMEHKSLSHYELYQSGKWLVDQLNSLKK